MATTQEILGQIQSAQQKITEGIQTLAAAENGAAQMAQQMGALGVQDKAAQFGQVRESIKKVSQHLAGGKELANQAMTQTKQAGG
jgi:methyl-accepting chemotaxis protein